MAVLDPVKLIIDNYEDGKTEEMTSERTGRKKAWEAAWFTSAKNCG